MIGRLRGTLIQKHPPELLIDVNGVGYELEAPMTTIYGLPEIGKEVTLFTHLHVRDDAHLLFGFATEQERRLFRSLIKVNGVGARMALTILSGIETDQFVRCIQEGDTERLVRLPGVGKKTAERLIMEMRDRLVNIEAGRTTENQADVASPGNSENPVSEAISALISLGYKPQEASKYVHAVATETMSSEDIIRQALKNSVR